LDSHDRPVRGSTGAQEYLSKPLAPPLRLLIASRPLAEGVPHHILQVIDSLNGRYEIDVVCPRASILWAGLTSDRRVRLHEFSSARRLAPGDLGSWLRLFRLAAGADLIHVHSSKAGFLGRLAAAARRRGHVCIFTPHGWSFWAARGIEAKLYRRLERLAARWCRTILVVSDYERSAGLAAGVGRPDQYRVVRNGVDVRQFTLSPDPVPGRVVAVGRLAPQKRPDLAVRAFARVRSRHPAAELHLVGDGPMRRQVERIIAELGLQEAVQVLGQRGDVPGLLARASCLLLSSDYEGCPFSVLEAMAAGVPVVATRVGGVPELVDDGVTGLLVEPGNHDALSKAVTELLDEPERARQLGMAGRVRARDALSLETSMRQIADVYEEVAGSRA
jgi:glycosyltransferase involved in cell wall biosynthesis